MLLLLLLLYTIHTCMHVHTLHVHVHCTHQRLSPVAAHKAGQSWKKLPALRRRRGCPEMSDHTRLDALRVHMHPGNPCVLPALV